MMFFLALNLSALWPTLGPIFAGLGGALAGAAAVYGQKNKSRADRLDYNNMLLEALHQHMETLTSENKSLRARVDSLTKQVQTCQQDKYEMQRLLSEWERKWEARINGQPSGA